MGTDRPNNFVSVSYPLWTQWGGILFLLLSAVGTVKAVHGESHWTPWHVVMFAAFGIFYLAYFGKFRTVFSENSIEQRTLFRVRCLMYADVSSVKYGGKSGHEIFLTFTDGSSMGVHGRINQLDEAQVLLQEKLPHLHGETI
jgi:hypothetical protein